MLVHSDTYWYMLVHAGTIIQFCQHRIVWGTHQVHQSRQGENMEWSGHHFFAVMLHSKTSHKSVCSRTFINDPQGQHKDDLLRLIFVHLDKRRTFIFYILLHFTLSCTHLSVNMTVIPFSLRSFLTPASHLMRGLPVPPVPSTPTYNVPYYFYVFNKLCNHVFYKLGLIS